MCPPPFLTRPLQVTRWPARDHSQNQQPNLAAGPDLLTDSSAAFGASSRHHTPARPGEATEQKLLQMHFRLTNNY